MQVLPEVIEGKDGHLFLVKSVHNILDHMQGRISIPEASLVNFYKNIEYRSGYCRSRGVLYKHFIYPDKITVLRDLFPLSIVSTFIDRYRPYFLPDVVDLTGCLVRGGGAKELFFKTDTHLTFDGKVVTSAEILSYFFNSDRVLQEKELAALKGEQKIMLGDLGGKMDPQITEMRFDIISRHIKRINNQVGANDGLVVVCLNREKLKSGAPRLLIFGDSFCERTLPLLAVRYGIVLFCRTRYFHPEIVEAFKPDHLITESAERYFSNVRLDDMAPRFDLVYGINGATYSANRDFYRAYNAILSYGRPAYYKFVSEFLRGSP